MEEQFAEAQYEGQWNPLEDDYLAWGRASIPADRSTVEGVASWCVLPAVALTAA